MFKNIDNLTIRNKERDELLARHNVTLKVTWFRGYPFMELIPTAKSIGRTMLPTGTLPQYSPANNGKITFTEMMLNLGWLKYENGELVEC